MKKKHAGGRPAFTLTNLPADWQTRIIDLMAQGASIVEVCVELSLSREMFYKLEERESEFRDTVMRGRLLCESWWEKQGRQNVANKQFNSILWYMNMKNRFGWTDKQETEHSGELVVKWAK